MKKEIVVTGKTVEEALQNAVEKLGANSQDKVTYEVLEEPKKGLFGIGAAPAKIHAVYYLGGDEVAFQFLEKMIQDMELDVTVSMEEKGKEERLITIDGKDAGALIGHHGETLDALQYLANLAANKKYEGEKREYVKISIDVEGYRAKREETLRALARRMASKVIKHKKSIMLEPMPPYERRIIHSEVQNIAGVSTNSIGSENNRKVVMYLDESGVALDKEKRKSGKQKMEEVPELDDSYEGDLFTDYLLDGMKGKEPSETKVEEDSDNQE